MTCRFTLPAVAEDPTALPLPDWQIGRPICPHCLRTQEDPEPGVEAEGSYTVMCDCGAFLEIERRVQVAFQVTRSCPVGTPDWLFT